jgi:hypothetical protein
MTTVHKAQDLRTWMFNATYSTHYIAKITTAEQTVVSEYFYTKKTSLFT